MVTVVAQTEAVALVNESFTAILESTSRYEVAQNGGLGLSHIKKTLGPGRLASPTRVPEPWIVPKKQARSHS